MIPPPPRSTLFPYTTLFRSAPATDCVRSSQAARAARSVDRAGRRFADAGGHRTQDAPPRRLPRSEEHTSELQSRPHLVCRLLLEKKKTKQHKVTKLLNIVMS